MEKRRSVIKWFFYTALLLIFTVLQFMVLINFRVFGVTPNIIPALVTAVALFEGALGGSIYGFAAGLLMDAFLYPTEIFYTLVLMLFAILFGIGASHLFRKTLFTTMLFSIIILVSVNFLYFAVFYLIAGKAGMAALITVSVPEIIYSFPFVFISYFLCRGVYRRWGDYDRRISAY